MERVLTIDKKYIDSKFSEQEQYILQTSDIQVIGRTKEDTHFSSMSKYGLKTFVVPNKYIEYIIDDYDNYQPKKRTASPIKKDLIINHPIFGNGTVLTNKKGITEIQFECGKKRFETKFVVENCIY